MSNNKMDIVDHIKTVMILYGIDESLVNNICILANRYKGVVNLMDIWYDECMDNNAEDCAKTLSELVKLVEEML